LKLDSPSGLAGTIIDWHLGDKIDFLNTMVTGVNETGNTLTVTYGDHQTASYSLTGKQINTDFQLQPDGNGGTNLILQLPEVRMTTPFLLGVNLAGAEFGAGDVQDGHEDPNTVPGVYGTNYTYPTHDEIDYYASKGLDVIRLPFLWERLQLTKLGPLDAAELGRLDDIVNYATSKGLKIEIEPHNYGFGFNALVGSATQNSDFADLWSKLASHYKSNPNVIFGLMNEPHVQSASEWFDSANAAIAAIRTAGAMQQIFVPGTDFDGAWTWKESGNQDNSAEIVDPAHNFAFEVHQYLDNDGSGTHKEVVSATIGVERVTEITQWAEATGNHLFLGEVGVWTDQTSLDALSNMLTYIQQHTDVWEGVTYWAGGPWWGSYMFSIEPENGVDKPQMAVLVQHLAPTLGSPSPTSGDVQDDYFGIVRLALPLDQATTVANAIDAGTQTEAQYVSGLLSQASNTTIPAVAVEGSMYGAVGTSAEVTLLATRFLPDQVAFATQHGLNAQVYASEALGLAFAFGNETGSAAFATNFGPSNAAMPNSTAGDQAFATAAATTIFGSASTANLVNVIDAWVTTWKAFYTDNGLPGMANPTAAQIDLAARGAAWGDAVGVALDNALGPLKALANNFLMAAAEGIASYSMSLIGQPAHHPFQGEI
jgi:endoglucanase